MSPHRYTEIENWFERLEIEDGVFSIFEPFYRDDYRCNIYVIRGARETLVIDTGLGLASLSTHLSDIADDPLLISSHGHYDHIGGNFEFRRRLIHPAEAAIVAAPTHENTHADLLLATEDFYRLPWPDFEARDWVAEPAPATGLIDEGDILDLGDRRFEVVHTPGHSWGSICLWEEASGTIFCADTVYAGELFDHLPCSDIPAYVRTLKRLMDYPVLTACPGHGQILNGDQFREIARRYIEKKER